LDIIFSLIIQVVEVLSGFYPQLSNDRF
jgi:hypothetical protein